MQDRFFFFIFYLFFLLNVMDVGVDGVNFTATASRLEYPIWRSLI